MKLSIVARLSISPESLEEPRQSRWPLLWQKIITFSLPPPSLFSSCISWTEEALWGWTTEKKENSRPLSTKEIVQTKRNHRAITPRSASDSLIRNQREVIADTSVTNIFVRSRSYSHVNFVTKFSLVRRISRKKKVKIGRNFSMKGLREI